MFSSSKDASAFIEKKNKNRDNAQQKRREGGETSTSDGKSSEHFPCLSYSFRAWSRARRDVFSEERKSYYFSILSL